MDRLHEIEVFAAVAAAGGFAKAGRHLRLSPPAITRAVAALEGRLKTRLFNRTTRSLHLTDAGARFLVHVRRVLADIDAAANDARGNLAEPHGHLTVTASATFGREILFPIVCDFRVAHPRVTVSALLLDRVVDLVTEGIDLAVRIGDLTESSLVARRVGTVRRVLVASPGYLERHGSPATPVALRDHVFIAMTGLMPGGLWRYVEDGKARSIALAARLDVNDAPAALAAAEAGHGITIALTYMVAEAIRARRLATVLDPFTPPPVPVSLVYPPGRHVHPAVRGFLDFAAPRLTAAL